MPEGDTVHRWALRLDAALGGREIEVADAPSQRSPIHRRAGELHGRRLETVEARGKHLLAHFSGGLALQSHLGMNGRWLIYADGRLPHGRPWLVLASGRGVAAQLGGRLLRLSAEARVRNDPALAQLGPDPLRAGFDPEIAGQRLIAMGTGSQVGEALLDQRIVAGLGNALRNEVCFTARISPFRAVDELDPDEATALMVESERIMRASLRRGRRPHNVYRGARRGCPVCGKAIRATGQGDANRTAYWCPQCQT